MARRIADSSVLQTLAVYAIAGGHSKAGGAERDASAAKPEALGEENHPLDFWVGQWDVFTAEGRRIGTNFIEKILGGCAVLENWRGVAGDEGKSLYVYKPAFGEWTQVWVTESGEWQEKTLIESAPGSVRFQGEFGTAGGATLLDRTTLTQIGAARVRQVVERSRDGGTTWRSSFEAVYVKRTGV